MLKSHLLFDICSKTLLTSNNFQNYLQMAAKYESMSPISTSSSKSSPTALLYGASLDGLKNTSLSAFMPINSESKQINSSCSSSSSSSASNKGFKRMSSFSTENLIKKNNLFTSKNNKQMKLTPNEQLPEAVTSNISQNLPIPKSETISDQNTIKHEFLKNKQSLLNKNLDWKITFLDGTQTVELNMADDLGKPKKTHVCLFCGKIYNRKYGLKIHLRTHTGYKPLKCKVCSRPFSDPSNLNKHVRLHSQGETPYRCPYCGKVLVRKRDLDRHIMSRHTTSASTLNDGDGTTTNNNDNDDDDDDIDVDGDNSQDDYNSNNNNNHHAEFLSILSNKRNFDQH